MAPVGPNVDESVLFEGFDVEAGFIPEFPAQPERIAEPAGCNL